MSMTYLGCTLVWKGMWKCHIKGSNVIQCPRCNLCSLPRCVQPVLYAEMCATCALCRDVCNLCTTGALCRDTLWHWLQSEGFRLTDSGIQTHWQWDSDSSQWDSDSSQWDSDSLTVGFRLKSVGFRLTDSGIQTQVSGIPIRPDHYFH